jgi:hypothetical protein
LPRDERILHFSNNKNILHIGATNFPYHKEVAPRNDLLHQKIQKICNRLVGLDISKEAIKYLKIKHGIDNIVYGSIYDPKLITKLIRHYKVNLIIVGEVVEHLSDPGLALDALYTASGSVKNKPEVIFTVPNYLSYISLKTHVFYNREIVHPDHNFWFSYTTFKNFLHKHGFAVKEFSWCTYGVLKNPIAKLLLRSYPSLAEVILFKCVASTKRSRVNK